MNEIIQNVHKSIIGKGEFSRLNEDNNQLIVLQKSKEVIDIDNFQVHDAHATCIKV